MKFAMTKIAAATLLAASSLSVHAAQDVVSVTITGGDFGMGAPAPEACNGGPFGSFQCITGTATYNAGDHSSAGVAMFNFFNAPVTAFLGDSAAGAAGASDWTNGFQGSVDTVAGTISLNLGGFYANWNGSNFLQGTDSAGTNGTSVAATGTISNWNAATNTGDFDIAFHSYITTAPFADQTGYWHITGSVVAAPVPEASTYGMMLAGLGLVGFAVRRRKLMA